MELAEPSIATAFDRCVDARGDDAWSCFPISCLPGRHWNDDIPRLAAAAAAKHPGVRYLVTAPFGLHPLMAGVMRPANSSIAWPIPAAMPMLASCVLAPIAASCAR